MIAWRSLELRLTAWYSLMLFVGYLTFVAALWLTVRYAVAGAVDDLLGDRAERLIAYVEAEADAPDELEEELLEYLVAVPESHLAQVRGPGNEALFPPASRPGLIPWDGTAGAPDFRNVEIEGGPYRILVREVSIADRSYRILLASSLQNLFVIRDRLAGAFLVAVPIALLLSAVAGHWIARRALAPVERIADAASGITVGSLPKRIEVQRTGDALERLSRALNEMLARLESAVGRIEQFSADASHELRTPLSVIRTTAELALRHPGSEDEYRRDLTSIHAEARHLSDLVEVLLALARAETGSADVPMAEVDLVRVATELRDRFRSEAEAKGLELRLDVPDEPIVIRGNEPTLRRMLASLLENALAHTDAGHVAIRAAREAGEVRLSVDDTGEGIPEEALPRIFDRFYRGDPSRSPTGRRLGLGLSIALKIAELHRAKLVVDSRVGVGSRFTARFAPGGDASPRTDPFPPAVLRNFPPA